MSLPVSLLPRTVPREREALLLAGLLRSARLTLLCGEAGAGKSVLLETGVMPLLHRRTSDRAVPAGLAPRVVIPFPERRSRVAGGAGRSPEVAILMTDWAGEPLVRLQAQLHEALSIAVPQQQATRVSLAGTLSALNMQFGARFIVMLDRFDDCLAAAAQDERGGARAFLDEFMIAVDRPLLPANFLIAVRNDADPLLDPLRVRLPGFGEQTLRLSRLPASRVAPPSLRQVPKGEAPTMEAASAAGMAATETAATTSAEDAAAVGVEAPRAAVRQSDEDWLASLNAVVWKAAEAARTGGAGESAAAGAAPAPATTAPAAATPAVGAVPLPAVVTSASATEAANAAQEAGSLPAAPEPSPLHGGAKEQAPSAPDAATLSRLTKPAIAPEAEQLAHAAALPPLPPREVWGEGQRQTDITTPPAALKPRRAAVYRSPLAWIGLPAGLALIAWLVWPNGSPTSAPPMAQAPTAALPPPSVVTFGKPDTPVATALPLPSPTPQATPAPPTTRADTPTPPTPAAPAEPVAPPPALTPAPVSIPVAANDIDNPTASRVALELARALAPADGARQPDGSATSPATPGAAAAWPAGFTPIPQRQGLALARYDALQAARQAMPSGALQVVAPLYTEEVLFVAHAGSPLVFIHDIRHARINVGPAQGARAVTAGAIYQRYFGSALPVASADARGAEAVLGALAQGKSIDVMVVAGPQAAGWWAGLPPETARGLKLLKIDRADPADRSALQAFLPATVRAGAGEATPTLAVMTFLVAAGTPGATSQIAPAVGSLCGALPALQRDGSPKWREFQPGLQLDTGWPNARAAAAAALRACATPAPAAVASAKR
ncbi:hypothetical protein BH11PSE9_BH11PSE9_17640 [soil metagenome]